MELTKWSRLSRNAIKLHTLVDGEYFFTEERHFYATSDADLLIAQLRAELVACKVDAGRYRWLRKGEQRPIHGPSATQRDGCEPFTSMVLPGVHPRQVVIYGEPLDSAIDLAMSAMAATDDGKRGET